MLTKLPGRVPAEVAAKEASAAAGSESAPAAASFAAHPRRLPPDTILVPMPFFPTRPATFRTLYPYRGGHFPVPAVARRPSRHLCAGYRPAPSQAPAKRSRELFRASSLSPPVRAASVSCLVALGRSSLLFEQISLSQHFSGSPRSPLAVAAWRLVALLFLLPWKLERWSRLRGLRRLACSL